VVIDLTGPKGDTGNKGDKGEIGATGAVGARGETGLQGATGEKGDKGEQGEMGPVGPQGETGLQGLTGAKGDQGEMGPEGPMGPMRPDPAPYDSTRSSSYKFVSGRFVRTTTETQYVKNSNTVLRVCKEDYWQQPLSNGQEVMSKFYGDPGCAQATTSELMCNFGFIELDGQCSAGCSNDSLSQCTSQSLCEESQMVWDTTSQSCKGSCNEFNLGACVSEALCKSNWLLWIDGQCQKRCSGYDLASCNSEARCTGSDMTWSGGECIGRCGEQDNVRACTTLSTCQRTFRDEGSSWIHSFPGYWNNGSCERSCGIGQIATANGCQDVVACGVSEGGGMTQWSPNNTCVAVTYTAIEPSGDTNSPTAINGEYEGPQRILSGIYDVTGDVTFYGPVIIDAGTHLVATGNCALTHNPTHKKLRCADGKLHFIA